MRNSRWRSSRKRFWSSIPARRMVSGEQLHEIAFAAETHLERGDISRLLGGTSQGSHAGYELRGFCVSWIAVGFGELVDTLARSEERRCGKEGVRQWTSRW